MSKKLNEFSSFKLQMLVTNYQPSADEFHTTWQNKRNGKLVLVKASGDLIDNALYTGVDHLSNLSDLIEFFYENPSDYTFFIQNNDVDIVHASGLKTTLTLESFFKYYDFYSESNVFDTVTQEEIRNTGGMIQSPPIFDETQLLDKLRIEFDQRIDEMQEKAREKAWDRKMIATDVLKSLVANDDFYSENPNDAAALAVAHADALLDRLNDSGHLHQMDEEIAAADDKIEHLVLALALCEEQNIGIAFDGELGEWVCWNALNPDDDDLYTDTHECPAAAVAEYLGYESIDDMRDSFIQRNGA